MKLIGRVKELWQYPVKSMAGERLPAVILTDRGIPGDRGWALRDEKSGEVRGAKKMPALMACAADYVAEPSDGSIPPARMRLPDGASFLTADPATNDRLSKLLGRAVVSERGDAAREPCGVGSGADGLRARIAIGAQGYSGSPSELMVSPFEGWACRHLR